MYTVSCNQNVSLSNSFTVNEEKCVCWLSSGIYLITKRYAVFPSYIFLSLKQFISKELITFPGAAFLETKYQVKYSVYTVEKIHS